MDGDEVDVAASSTSIQEILKPLKTTRTVGDCGGAEIGSVIIGIDVIDVCLSCILGIHAGLSVATFVGFIEGQNVVGAAGQGVVDIVEPLRTFVNELRWISGRHSRKGWCSLLSGLGASNLH
jgi:hypothetical protein